MKPEKTKTHRGFGIINFIDRYGCKCSLQKSSIATEDCIWLGCDDADPRVCVPGKGWTPLDVPKDTLFNTRMHLTREQVKEILPFLNRFVKTGEI